MLRIGILVADIYFRTIVYFVKYDEHWSVPWSLSAPISHPLPVLRGAWRWGRTARDGRGSDEEDTLGTCTVRSWSLRAGASWQIFSWGVIAEQRSRDIKVKCRVWSYHTCQPSPSYPQHPHKSLYIQWKAKLHAAVLILGTELSYRTCFFFSWTFLWKSLSINNQQFQPRRTHTVELCVLIGTK